MLLSNAVVLLLGALQPALGKPANRRQDEPLNQIVAQAQMDNKTFIGYTADDPGCADGVRAWVGVWPANASNPYTADYKARVYMKKTDFEVRVIAFNNVELGIGEFKAAFVCDDDKRQAWMVSENFKIDDVTPAKNDRCIYQSIYDKPKWLYISCDALENAFCDGCNIIDSCNICHDCRMQCGQANTGENEEEP